jgi:hypothetical protein
MVDCAGIEQDVDGVGVDRVPRRTKCERLDDPSDLLRRLRGNLQELKVLNTKLNLPGPEPSNGKPGHWRDRKAQLCYVCVPSTVEFLSQRHGVAVAPELLAQLRELGAQV